MVVGLSVFGEVEEHDITESFVYGRSLEKDSYGVSLYAPPIPESSDAVISFSGDGFFSDLDDFIIWNKGGVSGIITVKSSRVKDSRLYRNGSFVPLSHIHNIYETFIVDSAFVDELISFIEDDRWNGLNGKLLSDRSFRDGYSWMIDSTFPGGEFVVGFENIRNSEFEAEFFAIIARQVFDKNLNRRLMKNLARYMNKNKAFYVHYIGNKKVMFFGSLLEDDLSEIQSLIADALSASLIIDLSNVLHLEDSVRTWLGSYEGKYSSWITTEELEIFK